MTWAWVEDVHSRLTCCVLLARKSWIHLQFAPLTP
jgi:hypothetical protein